MSWPQGRVSDLGCIISGYAFKSTWFGQGAAKVIRIGDLKNGHIDLDGAASFDDVEHTIKDQFKIKAGDILMALSGATVGKIAIADSKADGAYLNQRVAIIRGNTKSSNAYLKYVFSGNLLDTLLRNAGGAAQPNLSPKDLANMEIPIPPLEEQKRIAAILDKADAIRRKRQQAIQLADDFLRAVFLDMFGDPVTNPKGWDMKKVSQLGKVTTGNTPPRKEERYYGSDIEWIKSDNINTPSHFLTTASEYLSNEGANVGRTVEAGSVLITCIAGSFDCIGNIAYVDRRVAFNQQINAISPNQSLDSWFLYSLILFSKKIIQAASTNSMKGMVSKGKLEEVLLIAPPISLQHKFKDIFKKYLTTRQKMELFSNEAEALFSSTSQKAFAGEL